MRIVYCSTPSFTECDIPLLKVFSDMGHEVHFFLHIAPYSKKSTIVNIDSLKQVYDILPASEYKELGLIQEYIPKVKIYIVNDPVGKNNTKALMLSHKERRLIKRLHPDIVQYVESPAPFHLLMLWENRRIAVCTIHDPVPHLNQMPVLESVCRKISARFIKKFILLNDRQTTPFCKRFGVKASKVFHAKLGPYPPLFYSGNYSFPEGKYILIFGRITPYKGIENGIEAMTRIAEQFPDVYLLIAGSGRIYFDKELYAGKPYIKLENRFIASEELASMIKHSLFVLCPYTEATQSGVVQTAFGLDTPVVVTDVGALADAVEEGKTGRIVPCADNAALAEVMKDLLENPEKLECMRNIIRDKNKEQKAWREIAEKYLNTYNAR